MDDDCILFVFIFYFSSYLYIFIVTRKLYYETCIKMIEEIRYIANGNFNHKVSIVNHNYLEELAIGVNEIVEQLKVSIDEERQAEQAKVNLLQMYHMTYALPLLL